MIERTIGTVIFGKQGFNSRTHFSGCAAVTIQVRAALLRREIQDLAEQKLHPIRIRGPHRSTPRMRACSQARAFSHSRLTVRGEIPRAAAASSMVRPAK